MRHDAGKYECRNRQGGISLAAEGLAIDLTETAMLAVPLYTVTASDRARALEACRSTYAVAA